jgi:hypothetical protein
MDYLHLFVFISFAIAQPIYDLLGKYPEFFVAHSATPGLIASMILILSFGFALVLICAEIAIYTINKKAQRGVHLFFVFFLAAIVVLPLIKKITISDLAVVGISGFVALLFTVLYARLQVTRLFTTMLLPVTLIFPLWFVFGTPIGRLVFPQADRDYSKIQIKNPVPIVIIVFDEFSTTALLDSKVRIDSVRFPNFAALASEALWFPNAITVSESTVKVIPSIVSGMYPKPGVKLMPTSTDYPKNLFTMLSGQYELNVSEVNTELCPEKLCVKLKNASDQSYHLFLSDLFVIYKHLIFLRSWINELPALDTQWTGFQADIPSSTSGDSQMPKYTRTPQKSEQLKIFLSQIRSSAKPQLFFMHTLLPHIPYGYLASGQLYSYENKLPDGILSDKEGWLGENPLIATAYHRYLQQVGYVDRFLGMLRKELISEAIYDDALLIVMADHGVAFEQWQSRRVANTVNRNEILKIPMFVKYPKQKKGEIDNRIVTSVDILPTIIDVIKADVPWKLDGVSLAKKEGKIKEVFNLTEFRNLNEGDISGFSRLEWQVENFGEGTPLDSLIPRGPFNELIGSDLSSLQVGEVTDLFLRSNNINHFQNIDINDQFLPSIFSGYIEGAKGRKLQLAVEINDKIRLTTNTSEWNEKENYFSVLLPKVALRKGENRIRVYAIEQKGKDFLLHPIDENRKNVILKSASDGTCTLAFTNGKELLVDKTRNNMDGYLDWLVVDGEMIVFDGWAADLVEYKPASAILFFKGEKLIWQGAPNYKRDGVSKAFNSPALSFSGYRTDVPLKVFDHLPGDVNIIALSGEKRAFRIHIKDEHKQLIQTVLKR